MKRLVWTQLLLAAVILVAAGCSNATSRRADVVVGQHPMVMQPAADGAAGLKYLLYVPPRYAADNDKWPLILFLHGAGERGDDLEKVKRHGPPKLVAAGRDLPFIVVSPQCPTKQWWNSAQLVALLDEVMAHYDVDPDRVVVTGLSMGGFGTWRLAVDHPDRFAAIAPICGGGVPDKASLIAHLPVWAFHGAKDGTVPLQKSQEMIDALKQCGAAPRLTVYPEAGHDSWTATYDNNELYEWLLKQRRAAPRPTEPMVTMPRLP